MARLPLNRRRRTTALLPLVPIGVAIIVHGCANSASQDGLLPPPVAQEAGASDGAATDSAGGDSTSTTRQDSSPPPPACPPKSTAGFTPAPYTGAVAHQGFCTAAEIAAFVTACGDDATPTTCTTWADANATTDAGNACGRCIIARKNNGGVWVDPKGFAYPNYAACIQLTDPTHGGACAAAYDYATSCSAVACDGCTASDFAGCVAAAATGECSKVVGTEQADCVTDFADGGAAATCTPGAATKTRDPDFTYIITLVCGT